MPPKAPAKSNPSESGSAHAFAFLERKSASELPAAIACFGADDFLRRASIRKVIEWSGLDSSTIRSFEGEESDWRDVHDELATRSLFDADGRRLSVLRNADKFVTKYRDQLERWVANAPSDTTLVLELQTLPSNVKLYKLIDKHGWLVRCTSELNKELNHWIAGWAKRVHHLHLSDQQVQWISDRIGAVCGLIDCELAKLALFAQEDKRVSDERVHELVGGWRTKTVWELADAVADGQIRVALEAIDKLIMAGQSVVGISAQLSWSLRRYGVAAQLVEQSERVGERRTLGQALEQAGFKPFDISKAEVRLRRIGRVRAKEMLTWFVELDLQLKGSHSHDDRARFALESLLMRLA